MQTVVLREIRFIMLKLRIAVYVTVCNHEQYKESKHSITDVKCTELLFSIIII